MFKHNQPEGQEIFIAETGRQALAFTKNWGILEIFFIIIV